MASASFDEINVLTTLDSLNESEIDNLDFGVIGFDPNEIITVYNAPEANWAGLKQADVIGSRIFEIVAPCMNNYLIAERLRCARQEGTSLDYMFEYVLTLRMRPTPVTLRLLSSQTCATQFILVRRKQ